MKSREELIGMARRIRLDIAQMTWQSGVKGAHLGGSMSIAEILAVLYGNVMKYDPARWDMPERDRLILSKAHAAVALYAALHEAGYISREELDGALQGDSPFFEHPKKDLRHGIEFSGGSLGQGLSLGVGTALGLRMKGLGSRVYVIVGDGECDEGQIWEAAAAVHHFGLRNLTVIVDGNGLQFDGKKTEVLDPGDPALRWEALGFDVIRCDGHDVEALQEAITRETERPKAILAKTVKGKGVSFAENETAWHTGRLTDELYHQAVEDIEECYREAVGVHD